MSDIDVEVWGEGDPVVLVHGSLSLGPEAWEGQRALADHGFRLLVPNRRGYGQPGDGRGEDYLIDAQDVLDLCPDGAHLVGHSYGALAVILAAAERPQSVRSLTVIEAPAFAVCVTEPAVEEFVARLKELFARDLADREFLDQFLDTVGVPPGEMPEEVLEELVPLVPLLRRGRETWTAELPLDRLAAGGVRTLVVSGGHHPAFDAVCDTLAERLGAEQATIRGAGHEVQMMSEELNDTLRAFWGGGGAR